MKTVMDYEVATSELNGLIGWTPNFDKLYPAGWPQAWAGYIERAAFTSFQLTGDTSWFFGTDPRGKYRGIALQPHLEASADRLPCGLHSQYLDPADTMKSLCGRRQTVQNGPQ